MDNQDIYRNNEDSTDDIEVTSKTQLQLKSDDFYNYEATDNEGFHYTLAMHKSAHLLLFAKVAENADVNQKTYRTALDMLDVVKKNPISYGKDPKAVATAALYCACLVGEKDKINQARIAKAGGISVVTLKKRVLDIQKLFPEIQNRKLKK